MLSCVSYGNYVEQITRVQINTECKKRERQNKHTGKEGHRIRLHSGGGRRRKREEHEASGFSRKGKTHTPNGTLLENDSGLVFCALANLLTLLLKFHRPPPPPQGLRAPSEPYPLLGVPQAITKIMAVYSSW